MHPQLFDFLDSTTLIESFGGFALIGICLIIFAETGLLFGFLFPGDTLLVIAGLTLPGITGIDIWWVCLAIAFSAFAGGEVGYLIGHKAGPKVFERKDSGIFSRQNVVRTNAFFARFGGLAVIAARFVPIVRTFAPIAAGVGHMDYRKYSFYNAVGALIWGAGLTFLGHLLNGFPPIRDFVTHYIDYVLLGAVFITVVPAAIHFLRARKHARDEEAVGVPHDGEELALAPENFDQDPSNDPRR
ncbi:DedA family protein [Clavibacter zhangzhiyongii]|uniref:DedA family protein n=1 Tax=Clavibacter zhangzhiyongii TaxID=2768071 RepID=UPI0039E19035